jgi:hypothetical protein
MTFYTNKVQIALPRNGATVTNDLSNQLMEWKDVDIPDDAELSIFGNQYTIMLRSDWFINSRLFKQGSLIAVTINDFHSHHDEGTPYHIADVLKRSSSD